MVLTIGLYAARRSHFVLAGPMAVAAMRRGHDVVFVRDELGEKPDDAWHFVDWPFGGTVEGIGSFAGDWLAVPQQALEAAIRSGRSPAILCSLDAWLDSLATPFADLAPLTHRTIRHGLIPTDAVAALPPGHRDTLLWFPPKTRVSGRAQRVIRWAETLVLALALSRLARLTRRRLVVKTRAKIRLPAVVRRVADAIVEDRHLYPHDSLVALNTAALAVVHQSAAGFEAVASGVPCLSVILPQRHLHGYAHWPLMAARRGSPFAWPGLIDAMGLRAALGWLQRWEPRRPDPGERQAYIDTWMGGRMTGTCEWIIREMERR